MIPSYGKKNYTTTRNDQKSILFKVFEGEDNLTENNNVLGEFLLTDIAPAPCPVPKIEGTLEINENSILLDHQL